MADTAESKNSGNPLDDPDDDDYWLEAVRSYTERYGLTKTSVRPTKVAEQRDAAVRVHTEILKGREHAARLAERHNAECRGQEIITAVEVRSGDRAALDELRRADPAFWDKVKDMLEKEPQPGDRTLLEMMHETALQAGFFIMPNTEQDEEERLANPRCVIAEAGGAHPDYPNAVKRLADCQLRLAATRKDANVDFLYPPGEADEIQDKSIVEKLRSEPGTFALTEDITCDSREQEEYGRDRDPEGSTMHRRGLAGAARHAAFEHVLRFINPKRGKYPIKHVGAALLVAEGVERPDGTRVLLGDLNEYSVKNDRTFVAHMLSKRYPAHMGYAVGRKHTYEIGNLRYKILARWCVYFHNLAAKSVSS